MLGSSIGSSLNDLQTILNGVENTKNIGICLDAAHAFQAGYKFFFFFIVLR